MFPFSFYNFTHFFVHLILIEHQTWYRSIAKFPSNNSITTPFFFCKYYFYKKKRWLQSFKLVYNRFALNYFPELHTQIKYRFHKINKPFLYMRTLLPNFSYMHLYRFFFSLPLPLNMICLSTSWKLNWKNLAFFFSSILFAYALYVCLGVRVSVSFFCHFNSIEYYIYWIKPRPNTVQKNEKKFECVA